MAQIGKRSWQRAVARVVLVALLLPALLGFAQAITAPADELSRGLLAALCTSNEGPTPADLPGKSQHQDCALCAVGCVMCGADRPQEVVALAAARLLPLPLLPVITRRGASAPLRIGSPPRGPPAAFST